MKKKETLVSANGLEDYYSSIWKRIEFDRRFYFISAIIVSVVVPILDIYYIVFMAHNVDDIVIVLDFSTLLIGVLWMCFLSA